MFLKKGKKRNEKIQFSKALLIQESILVWLVTITCLICCFMCIIRGSFVELPWLSVLIGSVWGAYGVSQAFYYKKSEKENTKDGITYLKAQKAFLAEDDAAVG